MLQGVNFASGGSGILDTTGTSITFREQISDFRNVKDIIVKQMEEERTIDLLSKSLFLISAGSNDMFAYYQNLGPGNTTQNEQFVRSLINKIGNYLKSEEVCGPRDLHIGCIPWMRSQNPAESCVEDLNGLGRFFNVSAKAEMHDLMSLLDGMKYSYGNVYDLMSIAIKGPTSFEDTRTLRVLVAGQGDSMVQILAHQMLLFVQTATSTSSRIDFIRREPLPSTWQWHYMKALESSPLPLM
ncbi:uncharacterized protein A4U43_C04F23350 [Asparagus officinalis]|uniref:Uncharacterized protein n=1 Tax=Asparagus officinalis TaxID=4686 RepID=A0A5P1F359_ASPOF|nr:uncharacterized protein A4U43_C04F23350 [Asparagus officinalis]